MRAGDLLVICELDRLGRPRRDLIELVSTLMDKGVGLQDSIDTTSSQGRLVFNIFASLAELERDLSIERTQAGLSAARARPKGLSVAAGKKGVAAEALYTEGRLSVNEIAENLGMSKATLYKYLRHRGVEVGGFRKSASASQPKTLKVILHLVVENNSKFVLSRYGRHKPDPKGYDYELTIPHENDKELDDTLYEILQEASNIADTRNGFIEADVIGQDGSERYW